MQTSRNAGPASRFVPKPRFERFGHLLGEKNLEGRSPVDARGFDQGYAEVRLAVPGLGYRTKERMK
jgi:hypothetical protein